MEMHQIAKLIQEKYRFTHKPTDDEITKILRLVKFELLINETISEKALEKIILDVLQGKERAIFESAEMSSSSSILQQIIIAAKKR